MKRDDILAAFRHYGLNQIEVIDEDRNALARPDDHFAASAGAATSGVVECRRREGSVRATSLI